MDPRQFHNLIVIGTIESLSDDQRFAVVRVGDLTTDLRPLPALYGPGFTVAMPTRVGAQVVLCCPSGNLENAVIVSLLWTQSIQPFTTDPAVAGLRFDDGTLIQYDQSSRLLTIDTPGDIALRADGAIDFKSASMTLEADAITVKGPVTQTGGDLTSDGTSLQEHKHTETGSVTQAPL